ncbi:hypothetical protein [Chitinophaga sp. sic0106]|uniref:hypothetical protein n=1 Tax=Chitinophaga sp. sic0106 TaxID=2854785 RepID=UPI001C45A3A7|nr:hypothetical protein [Chitinophaga sp. sic0106]MBV7531224.1 hypothetical protein [Chitinophaga sp. sic0106]
MSLANNKISLSILICCIAISADVLAQLPFELVKTVPVPELKRVKCTAEETKAGIIRKYYGEYMYTIEYMALKKDGHFTRTISDCTDQLNSHGTWQINNHVLTLNSTFQHGNLPVILADTTSGHYINDIPIAIVRNNSDLEEKIQVVLNDSILCEPNLGAFWSTPPKILKRVQVVYPYGVATPIIPIAPGNRKVALKILTGEPLNNFVVMKNVHYRIKGRKLIPL